MSGKKRHVRYGDRLDDDATIVIRGGVLDPATLRADALRYHDIYGEFGISVFATRGTTVDELAQSVPLVRFETLALVRVGVLRSAGFRLDPTGRNRQHFTVVFAELDRGVEALVACEHLNWVNPYHEH